MKLVHFADLHLDAPFTWLGPDGGRQRRQGLRETLRKIVDLAIREGAGALLCGGDLYEHERVTPDTAAFLRQQFERADPIRVYIAPGNHDWYAPRSVYAQQEWSPNVHIFTEARLRPVELEPGLTLWGAAHRAPANTDGFLEGFRVDGEGGHIALFHGAERGAFAFQGESKRPHAPFSESEIKAAGLLHAFLGHYHRPQQTAWLTYAGNPDPLEFGEDATRGAVVAEVTAAGVLNRRVEDVSTTVVSDCIVDVSGCASEQDVLDLVAARMAAHPGIVRLKLQGELASSVELNVKNVRDVLAGDGRVRIETSVRPAYDLKALAQGASIRAQFIRNVQASTLDEEEQRRVIVTGLRALDGRKDLEVLS